MNDIKKKNLKVAILTILLTLTIGVGISYSFFSAKISGVESASTIVLEGGNISVTYMDGSGTLIAKGIFPREKEWITKTFTVTGNNDLDLTAYYKVKMVIDNNEFEENALQYSLDSENTDGNGSVISAVTKANIGTSDIEIGQGAFTNTNGKDKVHKYTLKIYFLDTNEDQNINQGKKFAAHIVIEAGNTVREPAPEGWYDAKAGTLLAGIKSNYPAAMQTITTPGRELSLSNEAVLASTSDDYGTSYYYRGAITNNYVEFAGKCWRIVRVTGDGSIKLVLHNDNINKVASPCAVSNNNTTAAFARYSGTTYTSVFNNFKDNNASLGFMYGTPGSSTYAAEHENKTDSIILTNLKTWYDLTFSEIQKNKLADTIWCNDKSTLDPGFGTRTTNYAAYDRETSPSIICPADKTGGKLSKFTASDTINGNGALKGYKIGLLTYDEVSFAGGKYSGENSSYYLNENASGEWWWTMSPRLFYVNGLANEGCIHSDGSLFDSSVVVVNGVRPAISLKNSTTISDGTGTASDPFIVS